MTQDPSTAASDVRQPPAEATAEAPVTATETSPAGSSSKWRTRLLQAAVSLFIVVVIVSRIELDDVGALLSRTRLDMLALAAALTLVQLGISTISVAVLLNEEQRVPFWRLFFFYCFSWTFGHVSFGRVGEFSISYYLKREGIPYSKSLAIVLLDKVVTLIVFLVVAVFGTFWFFGISNDILLLFNAAVLSALLALMWVLTTKRLPAPTLIARIPRLQALIARRRENFATFRGTFGEYFRQRRAALIKKVGWTVLKLLAMAINGSVLFVAIGSSINPFYMMFIITITAVVALVPISLSSFGVVAASYIYLASLVGISAEVALATELLSMAVSYGLALLIALASLRLRPR